MISVVPYDPAWPRQFAAEAAALRRALGGVPLVAIEHVGSTAVPGLAAKPILDIDVVVRREHVHAAIAALEAVGYVHRGDLGLTDREALAAPLPGSGVRARAVAGTSAAAIAGPGLDVRLRAGPADPIADAAGAAEVPSSDAHAPAPAPAHAPPPPPPRRNVYVCVTGTLHLRNHLAVRDTLRGHPALRDEYAAAKRALAAAPGMHIDAYVAGKSAVLQRVLAHSDLRAAEKHQIRQLNGA